MPSEMSPESAGQMRRGDKVLSREDCTCPVCLEIFVEPVTLPCKHTFCKECFQESVDKAALCCPLCRRRVSTWTRLHSRNNTLINQQLWTQIQTCFPQQCERRLAGQEADNTEEHTVFSFPRVCQPGELRQEYEDQISKMTEERRAQDEEQKRASEELIQKLMEEEQLLLQEETRRTEEDQQLARLLSSQLNNAPPPSVGGAPPPPPPPQKKKDVVGHIEKFLIPRHPAPSSLLSNKENLLRSEPRPLDSPRRTAGVPLKRRSSDMEEDEEQEYFPEYLHFPTPPSSFSSLEEEQGRWQQEQEDRRLALLLQKELNQEEQRKLTDRRKGTPSAYLLRKGGAEKTRRRSSTTSSPSSTKTSSTSSSPSSAKAGSTSSCHRRTKQTTLTEMFPSS
ncbi:E3 ubiquitin-protein ligase rnf168 [Salarias fasciatus]|nr:E3 ubiquitin-protein ligase RNF168 [Salarias fasciatus]XP_029964146.1 E3 ubiquitin-protein ligase RNF168 [Salarias fasciatus]